MRCAAVSYDSWFGELISSAWYGPSSPAMLAAAAPYLAWLNTTAIQTEQTGAAFAMMWPPPAVATNRTVLANLLASNIFGQHTGDRGH
ncbi:PPE family protein [Mycobacterium stomatepiae]|nr:PPE family protein [Mycobacterium stomatepiae]